MNRFVQFIAVAMLSASFASQSTSGGLQHAGAQWKPAAAPLLTPWAKDVSPNKVWPEYPRPQMVRDQWLNLNGLWDYAVVPIGRIPDSSGLGRDGHVVGAPRWRPRAQTQGRPALDFDGRSDGVQIPRTVQDDFTIAFWIKTTQRAGVGPWYLGAGLVDGEVAGVTDDFGTALVGDRFAFGVGKPDTTITSATAINDGHWHHVAATRARSTGSIQIFVDGKCEAAGKGGTQALNAPPHLAIGRLQTNINPFAGTIADVRIYNRVLPDGEMATLSRPGEDKSAAGLVGWWRLDQDWKKTQPTVKYEGKILVPFPLESALSGVRRALPATHLLYCRRTFNAPKLEKSKRLLLHFGAVDWETRVYVNGKLIGQHRGGYDRFTFDITEAIRSDGDNELVVVIYDPTNWQRGKQNFASMFSPGGIMYTPSSGIWQTVWLEPVPACRIEELQITPDVDAGVLRLKVLTKGEPKGLRVEAAALASGREVSHVRGNPDAEILLPVKDAHLWTPDDPFLYDLKVTLGEDSVTSYFGMRKVSLGKDDNGITRILINGKFIFQIGVLDQGFWPDGIYTAPTDAALRFDVEMMRKLGLNLARKHVKVEPERWYYWCDKLGLLVWQDMPSGDVSRGNDAKNDGTALTAEVGGQFKTELKAMIDQHRNHPSIILWVVFNEGWGQHDTGQLTDWVKKMDPTRLASNASGWNDRHCGDIVDMHNYPGPGSPPPEPARAAVLGEFGGLGLPVKGHLWTDKSWGYRGMASKEELTRNYVELWRKVWQLKDNPGLSAAVYTQWTDVEAECNGLFTYDRKVLKVDMRQAVRAHLGNFAR